MKLIITKTLSWYPRPSKGMSKYEWWWLNLNFLFLPSRWTGKTEQN